MPPIGMSVNGLKGTRRDPVPLLYASAASVSGAMTAALANRFNTSLLTKSDARRTATSYRNDTSVLYTSSGSARYRGGASAPEVLLSDCEKTSMSFA